MEPLKVVIVGCDDRTELHVLEYIKNQNVELRGIYGTKENSLSSKYHLRLYVQIEQMIEREAPDLISICMPAEDVYETAQKLLRYRIPLFIEKPVSYEKTKIVELMGLAERQNTYVSVDYLHRFSKPVQLAKRNIETNSLGKICYFTWQMEVLCNRRVQPFENLLSTQSNGLDLIEYLCGKIKSVSAEMSQLSRRGHSTIAVAMELENGAIGTLMGTYDGAETYRPAHCFEIGGKKGRIVISDLARSFTLQKIGEEQAEVWQHGISNTSNSIIDESLHNCIENVIKNVREGKKTVPDLETAYRTTILGESIIESYQSGKRISVV